MNKKNTFILVTIIIVIGTVAFLTNSASKANNYAAKSDNWRVNLIVDKKGNNFGSLSIDYIGEINGTMNHFEYKLKGEDEHISGSEEGNWDFGYKYKNGAISSSSLMPNEKDQFEITLNLDGNIETLMLSK